VSHTSGVRDTPDDPARGPFATRHEPIQGRHYMKRSMWLRRFAALTVVALTVAACGGADEPAPAPEPEPAEEPEAAEEPDDEPEFPIDDQLRLGYILPETGPLAFLGPPMIEAVKLAVDDMNAAGGVLGNEVTLATGDEAGDATVAQETASRLLTEGVNAIVGAAATGMTNAILGSVTGADVLQCSGSNTGPGFRTLDTNGMYFRTAPSDGLQGAFAAEVILGDGHTNPAVVARADDYGQGLLEVTVAQIEGAGGTVAAQFTFDPEAANFDAEVSQIIDSGADALYLIAFDEGAQILAGLVEAGYGPQDFPIYGSDGIRSNTLAGLVDPGNPAVLEGMQGTAPGAEEGERPFITRLIEETGVEDPIFAAEKYDCAIIMGLAAELAGTAFGPAMAQQLEEVTSNGTACGNFAECKALIEAGEDIAYQTASGVVLERTESGNHEPARASYEHWRINAEGQVESIADRLVGF
jgi:ABC-type branched-subunit amino acid transport system substrate-binding protein